MLFSTAANAVSATKLLTSGILFSNSLSFAFLTKSVTSGILFSNSDLSASCLVFKTNLLVSMLFTFATNLSYKVFLTASFFTTSLSLLKSTGTGTNFSMSNLSTSAFKLARFVFNAKLELSTSEIFLIIYFLNIFFFCCITSKINFNFNTFTEWFI